MHVEWNGNAGRHPLSACLQHIYIKCLIDGNFSLWHGFLTHFQDVLLLQNTICVPHEPFLFCFQLKLHTTGDRMKPLPKFSLFLHLQVYIKKKKKKKFSEIACIC